MKNQQSILPLGKERREAPVLSALYTYRPRTKHKAGLARALRIGATTLLVGAALFGASLMAREAVPGKEKEVLW